ncbi:MAG: biopolymer transporter ExbD [Myxococcales bacterium]|nr:biopolymer transporter ExbD [Myxococcales bacterium]MCB9577698.1 biopolymer transporter ExbD [Polyangiaceae bacterium]
MAGIDVGGGHGGRRASNHEIPLIPFIDFLLCLVAFLLVTAVWSQMARINADARVPGPPRPEEEIEKQQKEKQLHVEMRGERKFQLVWKEGSTVVNTIDVERKPVKNGEDIRYPDLAKKISEEWTQNGSHRAGTDKKFDQAVLHTDNSTQFADVIAVIDAIYAPQRDFTIAGAGKPEKVPAFNVTFAVN